MVDRPSLQKHIERSLSESPVTVLLGARQTGKTTMAHVVMSGQPEAVLYDLERPTGRTPLEATPELVLSGHNGLVVIDEIQRLPALLEILRPLCDDPNIQARFLLLGSASPDIVRGVSESLAGRAQFIDIPGFSLEEVGTSEMRTLWLRGGFPRAFLAESDDAAFRWIEGFTRTFLERDIPALGVRVASATLRRFWTMLAHYHGQTWNGSEIARAMDTSPKTANTYRDLLAGTFMIRVLPSWHENVGKRQVKSPKVYMRDPGVLHHLLSITSMNDLQSHPRYGASWEGFALEEVLKRFGEQNAYFWSTQRGAELDLMLFRGGKRWGFEFKCTDAPATTRSMHIAIQDLGLEHLYTVYPGTERFPMAQAISALPLTKIDQAFR
ncbi:MAG: ATP-binding protein [Spirochaetaceae bacterium]|nr:MAG: ATP-binding protein [Spirochaetaceae bacterium]